MFHFGPLLNDHYQLPCRHLEFLKYGYCKSVEIVSTNKNVKKIDLDKATNILQTYPGRFPYQKLLNDFSCSVEFRGISRTSTNI